MIGHQAVLKGRIQHQFNPPSVFIHMMDKDRYEANASKHSAFMLDVHPQKYWTPDVLLSPSDFVSKCDFGFVNGLVVQANLGDDYANGLKYAMAIVERKPAMLIAVMGSEDPILFWDELRGFHE